MGAHAFAALVRPPPSRSLLFQILSLLAITCIGRPVTGTTEAEALLKFKSSLTNKEAIPNWNPSSSPCSDGRTAKWHGVICANGKVWGLQLENMGLGGTIDIDALSQLPELRTLSFKNNKFQGAIPDFHLLPKLRSFYLTNNRFSGEIPDNAFDRMDALRRVILTHNAFTGKIPSSLATLPILVELKLDSNQFQGSIPDFQQKDLPNINVANNQLEGPLPFNCSELAPNLSCAIMSSSNFQPNITPSMALDVAVIITSLLMSQVNNIYRGCTSNFNLPVLSAMLLLQHGCQLAWLIKVFGR